VPKTTLLKLKPASIKGCLMREQNFLQGSSPGEQPAVGVIRPYWQQAVLLRLIEEETGCNGGLRERAGGKNCWGGQGRDCQQ
jgi:hypothetical protein